MIPREFAQTEQEFLSIEEEASAVFELNGRFPNRVFRRTMGSYRFLDFRQLAQPGFWAVLVAMAKIFGDHSVYLLTQEPTPAEYKNWMNAFGALRFSSTDGAQEYVSALEYGSSKGMNLPALYFTVRTLRWFGSSKTWGIYGDYDVDLAVASIQLPSPLEAEWKAIGGPLWLSNREADAAVRSNTNHNKKELRPFVRTLFRNYKIRVWF